MPIGLAGENHSAITHTVKVQTNRRQIQQTPRTSLDLSLHLVSEEFHSTYVTPQHHRRWEMDGNTHRASSRPRPSSRPTTPLRPSSRSSLREAHGYGASIGHATTSTPPAINALEPQFAELADSMADLEANFMHLQLMHESLTRFSESFASFLYGLNMNAFCVDFPEVLDSPDAQSLLVTLYSRVVGPGCRILSESETGRSTQGWVKHLAPGHVDGIADTSRN